MAIEKVVHTIQHVMSADDSGANSYDTSQTRSLRVWLQYRPDAPTADASLVVYLRTDNGITPFKDVHRFTDEVDLAALSRDAGGADVEHIFDVPVVYEPDVLVQYRGEGALGVLRGKVYRVDEVPDPVAAPVSYTVAPVST